MTIKANNAWNKKPVYFNAAGWFGDLGMGSHGLWDDVMKLWGLPSAPFHTRKVTLSSKWVSSWRANT